MINGNENETKNEKQITTKIDLDLGMDKNTLNIKPFKIIQLYVLSNTYATFEAQFMKKLSNTKAELETHKQWSITDMTY